MHSLWPLLFLALGCSKTPPDTSPPPPAATAVFPESSASSTHRSVVTPSASGPNSAAQPASSPTPLTENEWGTLVQTISEEDGKFPSDNYVSNETSFLHVTQALEKLNGGAYIGVGPEQNFTYLAMIEPELAFVIDIRRDNMILHLLYKVLFESCATRAEFLAQLTSRPTPSLPPDASIKQITEALRNAPLDATMEKQRAQQVVERTKNLGIKLSREDQKHLRESLAAFGKKGMEIHYTMEGSARKYPSLGELLAMRDDAGTQHSFMATEELYQKVRKMQRENRVIPVVGDLAGEGAMPKIAGELKKRNLSLRVLYASNVEQYLFSPAKTWSHWIKNVRAMPWAEDGVILRVYFDQGRAHPEQRTGHRTTSMVRPTSVFLKRADEGGWKNWWEVATQ